MFLAAVISSGGHFVPLMQVSLRALSWTVSQRSVELAVHFLVVREKSLPPSRSSMFSYNLSDGRKHLSTCSCCNFARAVYVPCGLLRFFHTGS